MNTRVRPSRSPALMAWVIAGAVFALGSPEATAQPVAPAASPPATHGPADRGGARATGPVDPLDRGTPRGAMSGFLSAARGGDYATAADFLDLRRLPADEAERGPELARELKRFLDGDLWVDLVNLSDQHEGFRDDGLPAWQDRLGEVEVGNRRIPLLLQRVPRASDGVPIWKVAASTVAAIDDLYAGLEPVWLDAYLPSFLFEEELFEAALWKWLGLVAVALAAYLVAIAITGPTTRLIGAIASRGPAPVDARIIGLVRRPVRLGWTVILFALGRSALGLPPPVDGSFEVAERLAFVVAVALLIFRLIDLAALEYAARAENRGNSAIVPVVVPAARFTKAAIFLLAFLGVLGTLGVNVMAAVAGLGVGGIAIALAAQKSIENLFGGVTLFADRPVAVGDFCRYGDQVGTVEEIGLRSTRIRTLDRTVVTIPNAEFSNLKLENYARRERMRLFTVIGVRYETTPDQLRYLLARLRGILVAHPRVTPDPSRVRFVGFGAYSLDIEVFAYIDTADWTEFLSIREDIYLRFMDGVREAGTGFAFPSSTTYVGRDEGLDDEQVREAEERVARWRAEGELPFPNLPTAFRDKVENTLDWPPVGSPDAPASGTGAPSGSGGSGGPGGPGGRSGSNTQSDST